MKRRRGQVRPTGDLIEQLVSDYQAGTSMTAIAKRHGLHRTTVATQLRASDVELRRRGMSAAQLEEASQLYAKGWSLARLGERYDCAADTVRLALMKRGVVMRRPWERQ